MPAQASPIVAFTGNRCVPVIHERSAVQQSVNLAPSGSYPAGTLLGQVTTAANDVQTFTISGSPTSGSATLTLTHPLTGIATTISVPFNATVAAVQALVNAAFNQSGLITVGGATQPGAQTFTAAGAAVNMPIPIMTATVGTMAGGTPAVAVAHTTVGVTAGTWKAYATGNSDGSQNPVGPLEYDCATDAAGNITLGGLTAGGGPHGETYLSAPMWVSGYFDPATLVGLDSGAVAKLGRMVAGAYNSAAGVAILKIA